MKNVLVLSLLIFSVNAIAANNCESLFKAEFKTQIKAPLKLQSSFFQMAKGRPVFYQQIAAQAGMPTLVLLPGVNRSLPADYPVLKTLANQGYGILSMATSSHWESLAGVKPGETPFHETKDVTLEDFKNEAEALVNSLGVKDPIVVSLSFSSAMASKSSLPQIFVAPLVKASDSDPASARLAASWEAGLAMNPIFGPMWIKQYREGNYRSYWSNQVLANPSAYGKASNSTVIDGYVSISMAIHDFNLETANFKKMKNRLFMLGENESQVRLQGQFASVLAAAKAGPTRMILVRGAEHNVPDSEPKGYVVALAELLKSQTTVANLQVGVVDSKKSSTVQWLTPAQTKTLFDHVKGLSESTENADLSSILRNF